MDPWVTLDQLFEGGLTVPSHWNPRREDKTLVRLGLIWKCYQLVCRLGKNYRPPILTCFEGRVSGCNTHPQ